MITGAGMTVVLPALVVGNLVLMVVLLYLMKRLRALRRLKDRIRERHRDS